MTTITETSLPFPKRSGKVRDCYDIGEELLIVSTDRISAFDFILSPAIPNKGKVLTRLSEFWFDKLNVRHHYLGSILPPNVSCQPNADLLRGRSMVVRKAQVIPFECVVRGYLEGSGWKEYQASQSVCGVALPAGLKQCSKLPSPIFTPATKVDEGHDENVSFEYMTNELGESVANQLKELSLSVYAQASDYAASRGIIIADTKFEYGWCDGKIILIDEVLTPDSSRFWDAQQYEAGHSQPSMDKQFVREFLLNSNWDRSSPPPTLPEEIVQATAERYIQAYERLTGSLFE